MATIKKTMKKAQVGDSLSKKKPYNYKADSAAKKPYYKLDVPEVREKPKSMKKAQEGAELRTGQYKRLGRIAENNPERAERVAARMNKRASRVNRGKDIASPSRMDELKSNPMAEARMRSDLSARKFAELRTTPANPAKRVGKKMKNGGSLSGLKAGTKRVGPVDPKGAYTKVQKKTLAGAKGKASLTKDKQLGATKMRMGGKSKKH